MLKAADYLRWGWTKNAYARNAAGTIVESSSKNAVAWCLAGAVFAAYATKADRDAAFTKLALVMPDPGYIHWNDAPERTQTEVVALAERAGI
jgi:hypothetical protein